MSLFTQVLPIVKGSTHYVYIKGLTSPKISKISIHQRGTLGTWHAPLPGFVLGKFTDCRGKSGLPLNFPLSLFKNHNKS